MSTMGHDGKVVPEAEKKDRYYLRDEPGGQLREVTVEEYCAAERRAGFRPKMASTHPDYMRTPATASFSSSACPVSGETRYG